MKITIQDMKAALCGTVGEGLFRSFFGEAMDVTYENVLIAFQNLDMMPYAHYLLKGGGLANEFSEINERANRVFLSEMKSAICSKYDSPFASKTIVRNHHQHLAREFLRLYLELHTGERNG